MVAYAAELMGLPPPPETDFATAELSPMARSFYGENKRVSNARLKAAGYAFLFPDYRTGLELLWAEGRWDGAGEAGRAHSDGRWRMTASSRACRRGIASFTVR